MLKKTVPARVSMPDALQTVILQTTMNASVVHGFDLTVHSVYMSSAPFLSRVLLVMFCFPSLHFSN